MSIYYTLLILTCLLISKTKSLYFYLDTNSEKCFTEEMTEKTMAVEQYNPSSNLYEENPTLGIRIIVKEINTNEIIKDQKGASSGRVVFTSHLSGAYSLCLTTNHTGWFSHELARVHFDLAVGDGLDDTNDKEDEKLGELVGRVRDLNHRIADIRREQSYQKDKEAEFRDTSEAVNSKVVYWTLMQLTVLGVTCVWQVRHLKGFFEAKKLV